MRISGKPNVVRIGVSAFFDSLGYVRIGVCASFLFDKLAQKQDLRSKTTPPKMHRLDFGQFRAEQKMHKLELEQTIIKAFQKIRKNPKKSLKIACEFKRCEINYQSCMTIHFCRFRGVCPCEQNESIADSVLICIRQVQKSHVTGGWPREKTAEGRQNTYKSFACAVLVQLFPVSVKNKKGGNRHERYFNETVT